MTEIRWFTHGHEDRNDWLRLGLMRLHAAGEVDYQEQPLADAPRFGFERTVADHLHRHTSVIAVQGGGRTVRTLVDSEDSFFWLSSLIDHVDVYFCAGYNRAFFVDKIFRPPFDWQTEAEVSFYHARAQKLIESFGRSFDKVRPFAPIGPNLHPNRSWPWPVQKALNTQFRAARRLSSRTPWVQRYLTFEARYRFLKALRHQKPRSDIVLQDTLWGWPRHRVRLHEQLKGLSTRGYSIHSRLRWQDPVEMDGGTSCELDANLFPIETGPIDDYERMLAGSRLAVFATGFHYGWRNIVTLAMMLGLPIYCDPFLIEHRQDHAGYTFVFNASGRWDQLEQLVDHFRDEAVLRETKAKNQQYFDERLSPEAVARAFLSDALAVHHNRDELADVCTLPGT